MNIIGVIVAILAAGFAYWFGQHVNLVSPGAYYILVVGNAIAFAWCAFVALTGEGFGKYVAGLIAMLLVTGMCITVSNYLALSNNVPVALLINN
ncbi:hypothetical protein [Brucella intermedia]|uniref:hypothetical protein n=1 Tax=Brucella intermedia TaxID=94625 RepID=UPI00158C7597|nr:hypothetical protein [Brucella intermedia]